MADSPQDQSPHAGQVVRRVLLRHNIAMDPETAQLVAAAVQAALHQPTSRPAAPGPAVFPPPTASHCSEMASAIRPRDCSCQITGETDGAAVAAFAAGVHPAMVGDLAREQVLSRNQCR